MYRTLPSWKRASKKQKDSAVKLFKHLPTKFSCDCVMCYECGDNRTVVLPYYRVNEEGTNPYLEKKYMNYCKNCGKPKISGSGEMYGLKHSSFCPKHNLIEPTAPNLMDCEEKWLNFKKM